MALSTSTSTLAAGSSRTFNLSPGSALTLTTLPNCRVTVTETPNIVSASGVGGNSSRTHLLQLPQTVTYGPYGMGGTVVVANASDSGSTVTWVRSDSVVAESAAGVISLLSGGGTAYPSLTSNDGTRDILRMASGSWLQLGVSAQGSGKELVNFTRLDTNASAVSRPTLMYAEEACNPAAGGTVDFHGIDAFTYGGGSNANWSATVGLYSVEGKATFTGTASQTLGKSIGVYGTSNNTHTTGSTVQQAIGVLGQFQQLGTGTATLGAAVYAKTPTISAGAVTAAYGFYAEDVTGGTANYAIRTNAGQVNFFAGTAVPAGGTAGVGVTMSSTANLGVFFGSGVPTLSAAQGSIYMRTDGSSTSTRMYVNTNGTTGWTAVTTAA